jgi:hypothetical protein
MIARLVLVGLVAALGVTFPSGPDCDRWMGSAQSWACRVLADWDTWKPRESDAYCLPAERNDSAVRWVPYVSDLGRLAQLQRLAAEPLKSSQRLGSAAGPLICASRPGGYPPTPDAPLVLPSDHIELAMIVELCRIAEEIRAELQQATPGPDSGPGTLSFAEGWALGARQGLPAGPQHASSQAPTMQALPSDVFAPERPTNEIETVTVKERALPAEVFAPEERRDPSGARVEPQTVMVPNLPTQVFASAEPRAEVQAAINDGTLPFGACPAPAGKGSDQPGGLVNAQKRLGERGAWTSQPAARGVEPTEADLALRREPRPLDRDLDINWARPCPSAGVPALNTVTNSSAQSELTSIELGPDLDQGIENERNRGANAKEIVVDAAAMTLACGSYLACAGSPSSTDLNQSLSTDAGLSLPSTARAGSTPQTAFNERAKPRVVPNGAGSFPPPELDQAVCLTRDALRAWAHVFAGSGPLKVTTR